MTAADLETTKTYKVTVTVAAANASDDARLSALMVGSESVNVSGKGAPLATVHLQHGADYSTGVGNGVSSIAISATLNPLRRGDEHILGSRYCVRSPDFTYCWDTCGYGREWLTYL